MKPTRCVEQGRALRGITLPHELHPFGDDPSRAVLVECLAASVCHTTNWDRLRGYLLSCATDSLRFTPIRLASLTQQEFIEEFGPAFSPDVDDLPRRHAIFTSVADVFATTSCLDGKKLASRPQHLAGPTGIYAALDTVDAFSVDPHRKKARVFVQQLLRFGIVDPLDPGELKPAIEHHLIRLYLRTGRVEHKHGWSAQIGQPSDLDTLTALRAAVEQAMHQTAAAADLSIGNVNEIEWQIARSYCERDKPRCQGPARPDKPVADAISHAGRTSCPFAAVCEAQRNTQLARLTEPQLASQHAFY